MLQDGIEEGQQLSYIDKSLKDLDELIRRKKAELATLDVMNKTRSPNSFRVSMNEDRSYLDSVEPSKIHVRLTSAQSYSPLYIDKSALNHVSPSSVAPILSEKTSIENKENREPTPQRKFENKSSKQPLRSIQTQCAYSSAQQTQALGNALSPPVSVLQSSPYSKYNATTPSHVDHVESNSANKTPQSLQKQMDDELIIESISKALRRIEELERDRKDYALYIQRMASEKEEMVQVMEAQKTVIHVLTAANATQRVQIMEQTPNSAVEVGPSPHSVVSRTGTSEQTPSVGAGLSISSSPSSSHRSTIISRISPSLKSPELKAISSSTPNPPMKQEKGTPDLNEVHIASPSIYIMRQPASPEVLCLPGQVASKSEAVGNQVNPVLTNDIYDNMVQQILIFVAVLLAFVIL